MAHRGRQSQYVVGILSYNTRDLLAQNLENCVRSGIPSESILVLDNKSTDDTVQFVRDRYPQIRVVESDQNLGYAGGMNRLVQMSNCDLIVLVTADCLVTLETIRFLVDAHKACENLAVAGCRVLDMRSGRIQSEGADVTYPLGIPLSRSWQESAAKPASDDLQDVAYVAGSAMLVDVQKFMELRGFDESFFAYHEEVDLCWRARLRGFRVVCRPTAVASHVTFGSFGPLPELRWTLSESNRIATNVKNLGTFHLTVAVLYEAIYFAAIVFGSMMYGVPAYRRAYCRGLLKFLERGGRLWLARREVQSARLRSDADVLTLHPKMGVLSLAGPIRRRLGVLKSHGAVPGPSAEGRA